MLLLWEDQLTESTHHASRLAHSRLTSRSGTTARMPGSGPCGTSWEEPPTGRALCALETTGRALCALWRRVALHTASCEASLLRRRKKDDSGPEAT